MEHIDEIDEAERSENPALQQIVFNEFKIFVRKNFITIDYLLESRTRIQIQEVFRLEQKVDYFIFRVLTNSLDPFFRFAYVAFC